MIQNLRLSIESLITKLRQMMPKLYHLRDFLSLHNKKIIYSAWIESQLRYGLEVYAFATNSYISRLQRTQNKIVKILFNHFANFTCDEIYKTMKILKIKQLRDYTVVVNNFNSSKFKTKSTAKSNYFRKSTVKFKTPEWRNDYGKRNREYYVPSIFNTLPAKFENINNITILKKELVNEFICP